MIAIIPGAVIGLFFGIVAGMVFVAASTSHWLLDAIVHRNDLPVLGFGRDTTAGAGLWRWGPLSFSLELLFYAALTILFAPPATVIPLLVLGLVFHLINANSFFGFSKENPFKTPRAYAAVCFVGFFAFILLADLIFSGWIF